MSDFADLLRRQHRVYRLDQAAACGVSAHRVAADVAARRARRLLPGVYLDHTGTPTVRERRQAALLYVGAAGFLSWHTAADLHGFGAFGQPVVHVSSPGYPRQSVAGLVAVHRTRRIEPDDVIEADGLRVASPVRTIVDLAARVSERELRYLVARAVQRHGVAVPDVLDRLDRWPGARGAARLRAIVSHAYSARAGGEIRLAAALARRGYHGRLNALVEVAPGELREGDLVFDDVRVVVQQESAEHHELAPDIEADVVRDDLWLRAGWVVVRVTNRETERAIDRACDRVIAVVDRRRREGWPSFRTA